MRQIRDSGGSVRNAAKAAGVAPSTAARLYPDPVKDKKIAEDGDGATVEFVSPRRVKTVEDAIEFGEIDTATWYVDRFECSSWEMITKEKRGKDQPDVSNRHHLWRIKIFLKRIVPRAILEARKILCERLAVTPLETPPPRMMVRYGRPVLCEVDLFDVHFGKLAWDRECGENYDLRISETVFRNAVEDIISLASGFHVDQFLLPLGNDLFHIDNSLNQTTGGTVVDTDGRFPKIYASAKLAVIWAIEYMIQYAPVQILRVPGNHDKLTSFFLCDALKERFRNTKSVTVDDSPCSRKYFHYGCNLIGFCHGDKVPGDGIRTLPMIMASEQRHIWNQITNPEFHLGHKHTQRKFSTRDTETTNGNVVRWLASLSATDAWHFDNMFVGNKRCAEAYLYDKERGYVGHFNAIARTS